MRKKRVWLINLRKERNLSLEKMHFLSGISYGTLSKIERGIVKEISLKTIRKLSYFFKITENELLNFENNYKESKNNFGEKILFKTDLKEKPKKIFFIGKNKYKRISKIKKYGDIFLFEASFEGKED